MSTTSIIGLTPDRIPDLLAFYKRSFPRKHDIDERFAHQITENPFRVTDAPLPVPIAVDDDTGRIVGQFPVAPAVYRFGGKSYPCGFGYDYFVERDFRRGGAGTALAESAFNDYGIYFTAGVTEAAGRIHARLGLKLVGTTRGWLWLARPVAAIRLAAERARILKPSRPQISDLKLRCPDNIVTDRIEFQKSERIEGWTHTCIAPDVIEFDRSPNFLDWRYSVFAERYARYVGEFNGKQSYFVATAFWKKGLHLLSIVDYRSTWDTANSFRSIIAAGKILCRELGCDALQIVSSHRFFDAALRRNLFFKPGKPGLLYTNAPQVTEHASMGQRDKIFATLSDGDGELNSHYGG